MDAAAAAGTSLAHIAQLARSNLAGNLTENQFTDARHAQFITQQLDKIQNFTHEWKLKDQGKAMGLFIGALKALRFKYADFSSCSDDNLNKHTQRVEIKLRVAQRCAMDVESNRGKPKEYLNVFLLIIIIGVGQGMCSHRSCPFSVIQHLVYKRFV